LAKTYEDYAQLVTTSIKSIAAIRKFSFMPRSLEHKIEGATSTSSRNHHSLFGEGRMKPAHLGMLSSLSVLLILAGTGRTDTKVELKGVHLCCPACAKAIVSIVKNVEGASATCDRNKKSVSITATDDQTAQKALDALAAAGFYGDTGNKALAMKEDSGVQAGKVKSLTVTGVHNCCGQCASLLKATIKKVDGATGNTVKAKDDTFEVTGDFDAADLIKALNAAGFHAKVKQ
jgi:copper chaperone CopZ